MAGSIFLLAANVMSDAVRTLWPAERAAFSPVGVLLLALSTVVILWLAGSKRRLARGLGSESLEADAVQTTACWWLS